MRRQLRCSSEGRVAIQRRHMRVVGCVPVPNAMPGSSRITCLACAGGSCQVGTTQKVSVIETGSNWACVSRTQSASGTGWIASTRMPAVQSCAIRSVAACVAASSVSKAAFSTERFQAAAGAGIPGSPNRACSDCVSASASSTDTDTASSSPTSTSERSSTKCAGALSASSVRAISDDAPAANAPGSGCWCHPR